MSERPFDTVLLHTEAGVQRLTPEEFVEIPLTVRVRYLLAESLEFYANGKQIPPSEALRRL